MDSLADDIAGGAPDKDKGASTPELLKVWRAVEEQGKLTHHHLAETNKYLAMLHEQMRTMNHFLSCIHETQRTDLICRQLGEGGKQKEGGGGKRKRASGGAEYRRP